MNFKHVFMAALLSAAFTTNTQAIDHPGITIPRVADGYFTLLSQGVPCSLLLDEADAKGVQIAARNLQADFKRVGGEAATILFKAEQVRVSQTDANPEQNQKHLIIIGTLESAHIRALVKAKKLDAKQLKGKTEKYLMQTIDNPFDGVEKALVIAGSDMRGTIYGIYELSEQIGVSPWYDWADVPVTPRQTLALKEGTYTAGEPAVRYRGIFLNDEAPCLTTWVKNTYGTDYGDHRFYGRVFELLLRLRANYMWPAMWGWSFYADDPENSKTAQEMGIIMGTSHHEPMARNHQEWARHRKEYGVWDYATNQEVIDRFFREGIERSKDNEDIITIGMRGDGDTAMGGKEGHDDEAVPQDQRNIELLKKIFKNQRQIIKEVTGEKAEKRPQLWAMYKEVQRYYNLGLRPPKDVIMLLCDDNWGDVSRLPNAEERKHPGGWGMYYHVDYVGAPRNSKWLNNTPIQNLWEQMSLAYEYGVEKLWVLNVGDLKPMEYPITLFLDMAWNPTRYTADNLLTTHTRAFMAHIFGERQADEATRIFNLYCKYNGRVTAEMLDAKTYNLQSGEWKQVSDEYLKLEAEALRQFLTLPEESRDAYRQLILFPVQAMANLYEMYYAQAMNHDLYTRGNPEANRWADLVETCFRRDAELSRQYNKEMSGGKWDGMMIQKHIGYTSWNDNFPADKLPEVHRIARPEEAVGGYTFTAEGGVVSIEAEHYYQAQATPETKWTVIPYMGRTLSGMTLTPRLPRTDDARLTYRMHLPKDVKEVTVHVITKSTLAFHDIKGHEYRVGFEGGEGQVINFNHDLNEEPQNVYAKMYPAVARRIVEKTVTLPLPAAQADGTYLLHLSPLDPGIVFEKIVVDCGGYQPGYLFGKESPCKR